MATDHVLSDLFNEMYLLATQIEAGNIELPAPEPLKNRLTQRFEAARKKAVDLGFTPADVEDGQYAVAAFLDEVIQFSDWPGKAELAAYPLQRALFSENIAGANFFERLAEVRRRSSAALEVYYDCITLGFRGVQRFGGALNCNVHGHLLLPDGVFVHAGAPGVNRSRPAPTRRPLGNPCPPPCPARPPSHQDSVTDPPRFD